jgi:hypothetical protein
MDAALIKRAVWFAIAVNFAAMDAFDCWFDISNV